MSTLLLPDETSIRRDERKRLAALLAEHAPLIGEYAMDAESAVRLCALLVGLDNGEQS